MQAPSSGLAPAYGTSERYVLFAKLNYCSSEVRQQPLVISLMSMS